MPSFAKAPDQAAVSNNGSSQPLMSLKLMAASGLVDVLGITNVAHCCGLEENSAIAQRLLVSTRVKQRLCALCCDFFGLVNPIDDDNILRIVFLAHYKNNIVESVCLALGLAGLLNSHGPILLKSDVRQFISSYGETSVNFAVKHRMQVAPMAHPLAQTDLLKQPELQSFLIDHGSRYLKIWLQQSLPDLETLIFTTAVQDKAPVTLSPQLDIAITKLIEQLVGMKLRQEESAPIVNRLKGKSA